MSITLMSFNTQHCLNYITREIDFDAFAEEIRRRGADIIGLNEMRGEGPHPDYQAQAKILGEKLGYYYYFAEATHLEGENPYGNALLSRYPILSAKTVLIPDPQPPAYDGYYETRCVLKAKIDVCGGLNVCISHFGLNPDEHANAVETVLKQVSDTKCVLMGDFNLTPEQPLLEPIREKMYDTAQLFTEDLRSWPSDEPRLKIDYIFTSHDIQVLSADIPADVVSDHRPYLAVIEVTEN